MRTSWAFIGLALELSGCGSLDEVRFSVPDQPPELALLVELADDGSLISVSAPFGLMPGAGFGTPSLDLERGELDRAVLIGLEPEATEQLAPGIERAHLAELTVVAAAPGSTRVGPYDDPVVVPFPTSTRVWRIEGRQLRVEPDPESVTSKLLLRIPSNPEFCRSSYPEPFEPFGSEAHYFSAALTPSPELEPIAYEVRRIVAIDDDTILGSTPATVFVAERGGRIEPADVGGIVDTKLLHIAEVGVPNTEAQFTGIALEPALGSGPRRAWAAGEGSIPGIGSRGFLVELSLAGGRLSLVGSATISGPAANDFLPLHQMTSDDAGNVVAVGPGVILVKARGENAFRVAPYPAELPTPLLREVAASHSPVEPHLMGMDAEGIVTGDALTGDLRYTMLRTPSDPNLDQHRPVQRIAARADGEARWAAGGSGLLQRWSESTGWAAVALRFPPSTNACSSGLSFEALTPSFTSIALDGRSLFLLIDGCYGLLALDLQRDCVAALPFPDLPITIDPRNNTSAEIVGRALLVGGHGGRIYRLPL